jgi:hypothetical protein
MAIYLESHLTLKTSAISSTDKPFATSMVIGKLKGFLEPLTQHPFWLYSHYSLVYIIKRKAGAFEKLTLKPH